MPRPMSSSTHRAARDNSRAESRPTSAAAMARRATTNRQVPSTNRRRRMRLARMRVRSSLTGSGAAAMYRLYPRANEPGNQHEPDGMDPDDFNSMQLAWGRLLERYRVAAAEAMPVFRVLAQAYQSVGRYYHTLEHLEEMLRVAGRLMAITDDPRALQLAIWFHDAVYDPR